MPARVSRAMGVRVLSSPAMDNVRAWGRAFKVVDPPDEGDDGIRMVGDAKVWPSRVVKLLHLTTIISLRKKCDSIPPNWASWFAVISLRMHTHVHTVHVWMAIASTYMILYTLAKK